MPSTAITPNCSDEQLIAAACQGNRDAYGQLVRRYQDRLFSGMVQKTGSAADAEDVVQDAFVRAYLKLHTFRGQSAFFTWLYRIALNVLATGRRRRRGRETSFEVSGDIPYQQTVDASPSPGERLLAAEQRQQVQAALGRLSDHHRLVLVLREYEEFDYETIANLLNTNVGTVRSRIHRARMALRKEMQRHVGQA